MLEKDDFRTIIEDARARHAAVVALIYFTDSQALSLLRLYVTLGIATASGAAAGLSQATLIPRPVGWALVATTIVLAAGAAFCIASMRSGAINLPGRGPEFWLWAQHPNLDRAAVLKAYLDNLSAKTETNKKLNAVNGRAYQYAKLCSVAVPLAALIAGGASLLWRF